MSDQFHDARTYSKRTTNTNPQARQQYNKFTNIYESYAKIVKVGKIDEAFKNKVDAFRSFFEISPFQRPSGIIKTQWIAFYNK